MNPHQKTAMSVREREQAREDAELVTRQLNSLACRLEHYAKAFAWAAFGLFALAAVAKVVA